MKKVSCILLVDDDVDDNEFHEIIINEAGAAGEVHTAGNGLQALEYIKRTATVSDSPAPDLIFLDINMPRMNGLEFLDAYSKLDGELKKAVVCILTTSINPTDRKQAEGYKEVSEFCQKPLTENILRGIIEKHFK